MVVNDLRRACELVALRAKHVTIHQSKLAEYAKALPSPPPAAAELIADTQARRLAAWYWLTLDAINFGSGWFPTLRKRPGRTGYRTVAAGLRSRFDREGPWTPQQLQQVTEKELAAELDQDPEHELMKHFVASLKCVGEHLEQEHSSDPLALIDAAGGSAAQLVEILAGWPCFKDVSEYHGVAVPFYKRAQIAAADLARAGAAQFNDLHTLTMFADNLVPHVLRTDGILEFDPELVALIEQEKLIAHDSDEEIEIRACAVQVVELLVKASGDSVTAMQMDQVLWQHGQGRFYKASPRHRSRTTAY
ncbi:MAG: hypothetical protein J2O48_13015 [Solirubrobacterales bacterium]|nr:hypothetical protein [Solirubrobacterales bacterium]